MFLTCLSKQLCLFRCLLILSITTIIHTLPCRLSQELFHNASTMQLQPASSTLLPLKRSRSPRKQRYSAARAFYLTILVISALAIWSATTEKRAFISTNTPSQHLRRSELTAGDAILTGNDQKLVRRDESVRASKESYGVQGF